MAYDLIVVGGGVAGSSLARKMAAGGARVLLLEKETVFRDRVRGECLLPWGVADAEALGIGAPLRGISQEARWFAQCIDGTAAPQRDLIATTPLQRPMWCFYHPQAQGLLLAAAENAGVEVCSLIPGSPTITQVCGRFPSWGSLRASFAATRLDGRSHRTAHALPSAPASRLRIFVRSG